MPFQLPSREEGSLVVRGVLSVRLRTFEGKSMHESFLSDLRSAAVQAERFGAEAALDCVWQDLVQGTQRVTDAFFTEDRCFLVLAAAGATAGVLAGRRRHVLEKLLGGQNAKSLAFELGVALSTISQDAKLGLGQLGFARTAGRAHPLLVMSARASSSPAPSSSGRAGWFTHAHETYRVVGAQRPDEHLGPILPPAEFAVVRGLWADGHLPCRAAGAARI